MIGPGSGVAPFRAFVARRVQSAQNGERVGQSALFTGCWRPDEDFMYEEEWNMSKGLLEHQFHLHVAFSRVGPSKVYVQHLLKELAVKVLSLLENEDAHLYICGHFKMAKEVTAVLVNLIAQRRSFSEDKA
ncbi:NADPH-cytochrome P450 reductase [Ilyonectria robusta]